jgi:hypothetical protein
MRTLKLALSGAAICGALFVPPVAAQENQKVAAVALHDGIWQVATEPSTGPCSKRFNFKLAVEDGRITYGGVLPVNASGTVDAVGAIEIRVKRGGETLEGKGLVRGDTASGEWVSPVKNCTGSWVAQKI